MALYFPGRRRVDSSPKIVPEGPLFREGRQAFTGAGPHIQGKVSGPIGLGEPLTGKLHFPCGNWDHRGQGPRAGGTQGKVWPKPVPNRGAPSGDRAPECKRPARGNLAPRGQFGEEEPRGRKATKKGGAAGKYHPKGGLPQTKVPGEKFGRGRSKKGALEGKPAHRGWRGPEKGARVYRVKRSPERRKATGGEKPGGHPPYKGGPRVKTVPGAPPRRFRNHIFGGGAPTRGRKKGPRVGDNHIRGTTRKPGGGGESQNYLLFPGCAPRPQEEGSRE